MFINKRSAVLLVAGMVSCSASPALAHNATSPDGGSYAYNNGTGGVRMNVEDRKCDGNQAYGYANRNLDSNRVDAQNGCNTGSYRDFPGGITSLQACTNLPLSADTCSAFR